MKQIKKQIIRIAQENAIWGYGKIQGALKHLGYKVSRTTIGKTLKDNGFDPTPRKHKGMDWSMFINSHMSVICDTDFFTVEVMTMRGLVRYFVHFVIDLDTRRVEVTRIAPDGDWREKNMLQIARHLHRLVRHYYEASSCIVDTNYRVSSYSRMHLGDYQCFRQLHHQASRRSRQQSKWWIR